MISAGGGAGDRYIAVNNTDGPFKNVNLRKALWAATDREALDRLRGGKTVADVMTHFLWNGIAGFEEAGGYPGPKVDYNEHPTGDMAVAEKYMKLAGYPSGKYTGSETLQVVGDSSAAREQRRRSGEPDAENPRLQNEDQPGRAHRHVLEVLRRRLRKDRRLPERRLDPRLR